MERDLVLKIPMLPKVVVVVHPSQSKSVLCTQCGASSVKASPLCNQCDSLSALDPLGETVSYFAIFGYPVTLKLDLPELQLRFYELSKKVHPDKFTMKTPKEQSLAMRWSTLLNRAYQTLKDYDKRANYILTLYGKSRTANAKVPTELAESYFELQDLLSENPSLEPLSNFKKHLLELKENSKKEWAIVEEEWDHTKELNPLLSRVADQLNFEHYLDSMLEDVSKKLGEI